MRVRLDVFHDEARPDLQEMRERVANRTEMNKVVAAAMVPPIQRNFQALAISNRNKLGAPSSGFWQRMNAGVVPGADDDSAWVRTPREVALRYFGGTVVPKVAKLLAIPARVEAYNKSPRDFSDLRFAILGGHAALVQAQQQAIRYRTNRKTGQTRVVQGPTTGGDVFYWLVPSATINPDPGVLPDVVLLKSAAYVALEQYILFRGRN